MSQRTSCIPVPQSAAPANSPVAYACLWHRRVRKEPAELAKQRRGEEDAANAASVAAQRKEADTKTKMKGKNRPTRRHAKKQINIIEEKKPKVQQRMKEEVRLMGRAWGGGAALGKCQHGSMLQHPLDDFNLHAAFTCASKQR